MIFRSEQQRKAAFARMYNRGPNAAIRTGYKIHRAGTLTRKTGSILTGAGVAAGLAHGGSLFLASGGRYGGVPNYVGKPIQTLFNYSRMSGIPFIEHVGKFAIPAYRRAVVKATQFASKFATNSRNMRMATRVAAQTAKLSRYGPAAVQLGVPLIGAGAAIGLGGSLLIRAGYRWHGNRLKRETKHYFTGKRK